jgi:hypothetical protein
MSRLDSFIARMQAQRDCLNFLKPAVEKLNGPIFEVGLGNGRTYDHLRDLFPGRDIYVFERKVAAHPDCVPPANRLFLGDADKTIPLAATKLGAVGALIHTDLGTGDHAANTAMGQWLGPALDALAAPGCWVLANQPLSVARWQLQPEPTGVPKNRYFLYRVR